MRSYQIFAAMPPDRAVAVMSELSKNAPQMFKQALLVASASMNARPAYLKRQPFEKQVAAVRRALSRVASDGVAEEVLAVYFLECRKALLVEWLDLLGIEHKDGILEVHLPAAPEKAELQKARDTFCGVDDDEDRSLLLNAFAAQSAINWPDLEMLVEG